MRLLRPLRSLRVATRASRRINSHSRCSFFFSHSGVHGWYYHSPGFPYFFWRAGGNSSHSAWSSRPQWGQILSSSLSTSAPASRLFRFPEEPLIALPASGSRLSIRSTTHPLSGFTYPQGAAPHGPALLHEPELAVLLEALHIFDGLHAPLDPPLQDAPHVADPARVTLAGYLQSLPNRVRRKPIPPTVTVQELEDVRRWQCPHKTEVVVGRNPGWLGPYHFDVTVGKLVFVGPLARFCRRRMLGYLEPAVPTDDEAGFDQGLQRCLDALRCGPQQLSELFDLRSIVPEAGEDTEQLVERDCLGPQVRHPADVETGAASPRPLLPRRCEPNSLHPETSIAARGYALYI